MIKNIFIDMIVYLEYKDGDELLTCVGKVIKDEDETLTIGFNFYLGDAIDIALIKKEDILVIEEVSL